MEIKSALEHLLSNKELDEFGNYMTKNNVQNLIVIDVLNAYTYENMFLNCLEEMKTKSSRLSEYDGIVFSEDYEEGDDFYFGENKILCYVGNGKDETEEVFEYDEFFKYLKIASDYYIKKNPDKKEFVEKELTEIRKVFNLQ